MSLSATPTMMTAFGLYQEEGTEDSFVEPERIPHMLPLLEGPHGEPAEDAVENASVLEVVESLREDGGGPDAVEVRTIRWRGMSEAAIRAQLQPIVLHYRLQILLVRERTQRRKLEMHETNARVPLVTAYYKRTPVKWRLAGYMGSTQPMLMGGDSESMLRTPASTVASVSEAKREQQFRESFMRMEDTVMRRSAGGSAVSTPVRYYEDGGRSPSARNSGFVPAFSPIPQPPKGVAPVTDDQTPGSDSAEDKDEEIFDSTVAFIDHGKRK